MNPEDSMDPMDPMDQAEVTPGGASAPEGASEEQAEPATSAASDAPPATDAQPDAQSSVEESAGAGGATNGGASVQPLRIEIGQVEGSLTVIGGADQITVSARHWSDDEREVETTQLSDGVRFNRLAGATELRVPANVAITVREVEGDLHVERLDGSIRVNRVQRDARIEDTRAARITFVDGDFTAEHVDQLELEVSGSDVWLDGVSSYAMLGRVGGDLEARRIGALTVTEAVGGDAQIERSGPVTLEGPIGGDLELRRIEGMIRLTTTGGDLEVNDAREIAGRVVGGDLTLEGISGAATFETVGGDANLTNTFGPVTLGVVGGDLEVERAPGGVSLSRVGGDVNLDTLLKPDAKYTINAGGDISLRVRGDVNARFVAQSFGGEIHTRLPLAVERGRRRNLVGSLGTGAATVTLQSGGDITIVAADGDRGAESMSDEFDSDEQPGTPGGGDRTFEGNVAGRKFRVRVQNSPNHAGFQFKGPFHPDDAEGGREFNVEWERGRGAWTSGEYSEQLDALRDRAEKLASRAGEEARKYTDAAAKRARETDWEAVGREVRSTIERAMGDLEDAFGRVRKEWEPRGGSSSGSGDAGARPSGGAQRVRIEQDDQPDAGTAWSAGASASAGQDADAVRRQVLEDLRNGRISLDEAERRLNSLR